NYNGTISDANITGNAISSSANPALSTGGAITLNLFGSASTVASLTKAEINTNTITNFPGGPGIKVQGAQTTSSGAPAGNYGTPSGAPGTGSNIVQIHNNLVTGDATNKLNGNAIEASVTGKGVGNFDITGNGTVANPITNILGQGIAIGAAGSVTATFNVVNNNLSQLNNSLNSDGIGLGIDKNTQSDASTLANPTVKATIDNNMVGATEGAGIHELLRDSDAVVELRLIRNTVTTAPVNPFFSGIELTSGSSGSPTYDPTLCAQIGGAGTGNTSPPGAVNGADQRPGIVLNKRSTSATTYVFGIVGFTPAPPNTTQVEAYVTSQNPGSGLGAGVYAGKRVSVNTGDNYTGCALSF
ncbi:MAG TPA: hypothetical protein VGO92_04455, partial [Acidimicrobiales bacterium]|nr:hypothetical protein [Acidimicrobiales bacterium]